MGMETTQPITTNKIALDAALVEEFKSYQKNIRDNTVAMALKPTKCVHNIFQTEEDAQDEQIKVSPFQMRRLNKPWHTTTFPQY